MSNRIIERWRQCEGDLRPQGSRESLDWFRRVVRKDRKIRNVSSVQEGYRRSNFKPGSMVTYYYSPKYEKVLPYYDEHPLVILLEHTKDGWYGANLHYLSPKLRVDLMVDVGFSGKSLHMIKENLNKNPMALAATKRYLISHVKGPVIEIPQEDWDITIQLPFEAFRKQINRTVWMDTQRKF